MLFFASFMYQHTSLFLMITDNSAWKVVFLFLSVAFMVEDPEMTGFHSIRTGALCPCERIFLSHSRSLNLKI